MVDLGGRDKGEVNRYVDQGVHSLQSLQRGPNDDAVLPEQKAGRYVGVPMGVVVYHLDVVLKLWRARVVLRDDGSQGARCLRLQRLGDEGTVPGKW